MDLIYMDKNKVEKGVLMNYNLDLDIGLDNDFEIMVGTYNYVLRHNDSFYIDGTEYGGIIDSIKADTRSNHIFYSGRTWRGILGTKIIKPPQGQGYYTVRGDANTIIAEMIAYTGLQALFKADTSLSGIDITNYSFNRYTSVLNGLNAALATKGARLKIRYTDRMVVLSAEAVENKSEEIEISRDSKISFIAEDKQNRVNHLICLGQGELADRQVIDLYVQQDGTIGDNQFYFGIDEVTDVYDYSSAESLEELRKGGIERLKELRDGKSIEVNVEDMDLELGDIIGGKEEITGITVERPITQKIVRIKNGNATIEYKVGD